MMKPMDSKKKPPKIKILKEKEFNRYPENKMKIGYINLEDFIEQLDSLLTECTGDKLD